MTAIIGEARCMQCARTAATARLWPGGLHLTPVAPEHAESVRRRRCPYCLGNLLVVDTQTEEIAVKRRFTPDELVPKRGRPVRASSAPRPPKHYGTCADCGGAAAKPDATRCQDCETKRRRAQGHVGALADILRQDGPTHRTDLMQRLGVSWDVLRCTIRRARAASYPIVLAGPGLYRWGSMT